MCACSALPCPTIALQVQSFRDDPLVFKGNLRAQTGNELLKVGRTAWQTAPASTEASELP